MTILFNFLRNHCTVTISFKISISNACLEYFLEKLKDHKEIKVDATQIEVSLGLAKSR